MWRKRKKDRDSNSEKERETNRDCPQGTQKMEVKTTEEKGEKYRKNQKTRQSNKGNYKEIRTKKSIIEEIEYIKKGQQMNFQLLNQSHRQSCA